MNNFADAVSNPGPGAHAWNRRARYFNTDNAFALELSRYAVIRAKDTLKVEVHASTQLFCILKGRGTTEVAGERIERKAGDVPALPGAARATHSAKEHTIACW